MDTAASVHELLGLRRPPVAVGFFAAPPAGLQRWAGGTVPSRCAFWRSAMEGQAFYTTPDEHVSCVVGAYTHSGELPAERAHELHAAHGFGGSDPFLEVQHLPRLPVVDEVPAVVAYGPLTSALFPAAMVVVTATPAQAMMLHEAAVRAHPGAAAGALVARPGCALMAIVQNRQAVSFSLGCKHNRKFTALGDDELYLCVPASLWDGVVARLRDVLKD